MHLNLFWPGITTYIKLRLVINHGNDLESWGSGWLWLGYIDDRQWGNLRFFLLYLRLLLLGLGLLWLGSIVGCLLEFLLPRRCLLRPNTLTLTLALALTLITIQT